MQAEIDSSPGAGRLDWTGALLSAAGLVAVIYGIISEPARGWDPSVLTALAGGAALLAAFTAWQLRAASPLVDLRLFESRGFTWGSVAFAVVSFAMTGVLFVLTPYLQIVQGADAQVTGLRLLPMIGAMLVSAAVLAAGALLVLLFLPGRDPEAGRTSADLTRAPVTSRRAR
jgi:MFS transporter, DHA2 family, multidrug resistance protein